MRRLARELAPARCRSTTTSTTRDELLDADGRPVGAEMLVPGEVPGRLARGAARDRPRTAAPRSRATPGCWGAARAARGTPNLLRHIEQSAQSVAGLVERGSTRRRWRSCRGRRLHDRLHVARARVRQAEERRGREALRGASTTRTSANCWRAASSRSLSQFVARGEALPETDRFDDGLDWLLDGFAASSACNLSALMPHRVRRQGPPHPGLSGRRRLRAGGRRSRCSPPTSRRTRRSRR